MATQPEINRPDEIAALQRKLYEAEAEAKSLRIQLDYARAELIDARAELEYLTPGRVETIV